MKLLLENWRQYLLKEQTELFGYHISPTQKIFISAEPYAGFREVSQEKPKHAAIKPKGLWYGCGDSWIEWVRGEMPHWLEKANYLYEVKLGEDIFQVSNDDEFGDFQDEFGFTPQGAYDPRSRAIDWKYIQNLEYNGVEICPYLWERRQEDWYYGWDVASGCIWNSAGVSDIVLLAKREEEIEQNVPDVNKLKNLKLKVGKAVEELVGDWIYDDYTGWEDIDPENMSEEEFMKKLKHFVNHEAGISGNAWDRLNIGETV